MCNYGYSYSLKDQRPVHNIILVAGYQEAERMIMYVIRSGRAIRGRSSNINSRCEPLKTFVATPPEVN